MNKLLKIAFAAVLFCLIGSLHAQQKVGHLNYGNLLSSLDEVKKADEQLVALQKSLREKLEAETKKFESDYTALAQRVNQGEMSKIEVQQAEATLNKQRDELVQMEKDMQNQILQERQRLIQPIVDRVNNAIEDVANENGLSMVFDVSLGGLLFVEDSKDVLELVKARL